MIVKASWKVDGLIKLMGELLKICCLVYDVFQLCTLQVIGYNYHYNISTTSIFLIFHHRKNVKCRYQMSFKLHNTNAWFSNISFLLSTYKNKIIYNMSCKIDWISQWCQGWKITYTFTIKRKSNYHWYNFTLSSSAIMKKQKFISND